MSKPILYSYYRSSSAYRVRIALQLKDFEFEFRAVHLVKDGGEQKKSDFVNLNPMAQVPFFVHEKAQIAQSMAIIEYIDRVWESHPKLIPDDPVQAARVRELCEIVNSGIQPLQNLSVLMELKSSFNADEEKRAEWSKYWIRNGLIALDKNLSLTMGKHAVGDTPTAADVFIVPQIYNANRFGVDMSEFPNVSFVVKSALNIDAFQKAHPSMQPDAPEKN